MVPSNAPAPRRVTNGIDGPRVAMILAVLQRKAGLKLHTREVYVSTVGGARVSDPATDLAAAIAIASACAERAFDRPIIAVGEVGLSGELRRVPGTERRLAEAARLGFELALVPSGSRVKIAGMRVVEAATLADALGMLQLRREVQQTTTRLDPGHRHLAAVE